VFDCSRDAGKAKGQGSVVRVCIEPSATAIADGFRMKHIENFKFRKEDQCKKNDNAKAKDPNPNAKVYIEQDAVVNKGKAPNQLTRLICPS
jgi:hypothetical protein